MPYSCIKGNVPKLLVRDVFRNIPKFCCYIKIVETV
jgi:hypothetical protein